MWLVLNDSEMRKEKQELLERPEKDSKFNQLNEQEPWPEVGLQGDFLDDEYDGDFWIKVSLKYIYKKKKQ